MKLLLLWLFVINLGIAFGAGVYEHRIVVSRWIDTSSPEVRWNPDAARADDTGRRFWVFVTTVPLTLLALANLLSALMAGGALRGWWLAASGAALADRAVTFLFFIPTMIALIGSPEPSASVAAATRWSTLNYLRHVMVLAAWLAALRTFALVYQQRG